MRVIPNPSDFLLSTPHGALGTDGWSYSVCGVFNLSTPHGALGTTVLAVVGGKGQGFQLHTVH